MKWHSFKKYKNVHPCVCTLLRLENDDGYSFLVLGEYDGSQWVDWENKERVEFDDYKLTHFCIPDPIEKEL